MNFFSSTQDIFFARRARHRPWSRLPGVMRGDKLQKLVAVGLGAASWEEWEDGNIDDGLPDDSDLSEFLQIPIEEPKHILKGFLRKGQLCMLSGGSKSNKTWTSMECALAISQGGRFLSWEAIASNVYYVDTELEAFDFQKPMNIIARQKRFAINHANNHPP